MALVFLEGRGCSRWGGPLRIGHPGEEVARRRCRSGPRISSSMFGVFAFLPASIEEPVVYLSRSL